MKEKGRVSKVVRMNIPFEPDVYQALREAKKKAAGETMVRLINQGLRKVYVEKEPA